MKKNATPEITRDKFIESIYHIVFYGNITRNFDSSLKSIADKISDKEKMVVKYSIQWNAMIITVSLLDELNKYLFLYEPIDEDVKERINSYKHSIEPILEEIDKCNDIRKFRNNALAHNFRINSEGFRSVHLSNKLHTYNIPGTTMDLFILFKYLDAIIKIAEQLFAAEYEEALTIIDSFEDSKSSTQQSVDDEMQKANLILLEVNNRIAKLKNNQT